MSHRLNRRQMLSLAALAGAGMALSPVRRLVAAEGKKPKILFLTKSSGFQHSVITRKGDQLGHAEKLLTEMADTNGYEVVCSKDASLLNPDKIGQWDAFAFYTTEDLTKPSPKGKDRIDEPPMSPDGKQAFLKAIADGKGLIGFHCATDTFHSPNYRDKSMNKQSELLRDFKYDDVRDEYIKMIGGEFAGHGSQQKARQRVASKTFPGLEDLSDFEFQEEWYNLMNLSDDLHVILVQETSTMQTEKGADAMYKRPPYPSTWARQHGKGRVFYTSMGHREDVWTNPIFQKVTLAGLAWITGKTQFDPRPNVAEATPKAVTFPAVKVG